MGGFTINNFLKVVYELSGGGEERVSFDQLISKQGISKMGLINNVEQAVKKNLLVPTKEEEIYKEHQLTLSKKGKFYVEAFFGAKISRRLNRRRR